MKFSVKGYKTKTKKQKYSVRNSIDNSKNTKQNTVKLMQVIVRNITYRKKEVNNFSNRSRNGVIVILAYKNQNLKNFKI